VFWLWIKFVVVIRINAIQYFFFLWWFRIWTSVVFYEMYFSCYWNSYFCQLLILLDSNIESSVWRISLRPLRIDPTRISSLSLEASTLSSRVVLSSEDQPSSFQVRLMELSRFPIDSKPLPSLSRITRSGLGFRDGNGITVDRPGHRDPREMSSLV